ncbi:MAG TPA: acyl-CoA thioesterase domain-containing protein, partial [Acidimicrobiales bacterium]|nr:acyl-CoA thioesterase domain-containing protein [Acidimicrobiales bacterium]
MTVDPTDRWRGASDLIEVLDVRPAGECRFEGTARADPRRPVVEGSQILAQAIVAAGRHTSGRRPVSAQMIFARPADANSSLVFDFEELSAGKTFTALTVLASQGDRRCAAGTLLMDVTAPDLIRHEGEPPDVPGPDDSEPYDMGLQGREVKVVGGAYTDDPDAPVGPPVLDAWVRFE